MYSPEIVQAERELLTQTRWALGDAGAPMVGGLLSSAFLPLEIIPVVYAYWRYAQLRHAQKRGVSIGEVCGIEG